MPNEPRFELLFEMSFQLETPLQLLGETPHGTRAIGVVREGSFEGPRLKGRLLPGGGDWFLTRPDGVGELDVRVTLETDDGALIYMSYRGYMSPSFQAREQVPPEDRYYVVTPYFETSAPQYAWLQRMVTIGMGGSTLSQGSVGYRFFAVR
jgi:hypothetical protein